MLHGINRNRKSLLKKRVASRMPRRKERASKRLNEQVKRNRKRFLLRQCFHIASSQNQIGPILNKLQQTDRYPAVDMAAASTELAGLPECSAETLPPHPHFHLQASRRAGVLSAGGVRIVNGYALL